MPSGFSVEWEHYNSVMCSGFRELQQNAEFVDMTIAADGHLVRVHQLVVGLASPYIKELLRSVPNPNPVLFLNNVSYKTLCCILEYIYTGEVVVPANDLKTFIATGKALHVRGLEDMIEQDPQFVLEVPEVKEADTVPTYESTKEPAAVSSAPATPWVLGKRPVQMSSENRSATLVKMPNVSSVPIKKPKVETDSDEDIHGEDEMYERLEEEEDDQDCTEEVSYEEIVENDDTEQVNSTLEDLPANIPKKPHLMFTMSNQGGLQLILNRCLYRVRNKYKDGRRRWECVDNGRLKCNASAITTNDALIRRSSMHNHPFHDKKIMAKVNKNLVFASIKSVNSKFL